MIHILYKYGHIYLFTGYHNCTMYRYRANRPLKPWMVQDILAPTGRPGRVVRVLRVGTGVGSCTVISDVVHYHNPIIMCALPFSSD